MVAGLLGTACTAVDNDSNASCMMMGDCITFKHYYPLTERCDSLIVHMQILTVNITVCMCGQNDSS